MQCIFVEHWSLAIHDIFFIVNEMVIIWFLSLCIPSLLKSGVGIRYLIYISKKYKCITKFLKWHLFQEWHAYTSLKKKLLKIYCTQLPAYYLELISIVLFSLRNVGYVSDYLFPDFVT